MEGLPLVPAIKIIDYLSIEDILNLKLVNKWFNQFINDNVKIEHLVLSNNGHVPYNRIFFYTWHPINLQHLIEYDMEDDYLNFDRPLILSQLKQLYIKSCNITLETLNSLDGLVHLEIINSEIMSIANSDVLRLPMLEILNLNESDNDSNLLVDSTKLQALKICTFCVDLVHPESITFLEVNWYSECEHFLPKCINLQHFYCRDLDSIVLSEFNLIKNLSKLESIHLDKPSATFVSLVNEKMRFNKDLRIYFLNLEFDELPKRLADTDLEDFFIDNDTIQYYAEHYSRLANHCPFVDCIHYHHLGECFDRIQENFMKRFINCFCLIVDEKVNDLDQLVRVLGECKTITSLHLPSSLGQHFFDFHLYNLCPNIDALNINGKQVLNCEFILKFKNILRLSVNQIESIELVRRLVESPKKIYVEFSYFYNRDSFRITFSKYITGCYCAIAIFKGREKVSFVLKSLDDLYKLETYLNVM